MDDTRIYTRTERLLAQHALNEEELERHLARRPEEGRWASGGWLSGECQADGKLVGRSATGGAR